VNDKQRQVGFDLIPSTNAYSSAGASSSALMAGEVRLRAPYTITERCMPIEGCMNAPPAFQHAGGGRSLKIIHNCRAWQIAIPCNDSATQVRTAGSNFAIEQNELSAATGKYNHVLFRLRIPQVGIHHNLWRFLRTED
jgi:hypothetical protein